MPESLQERIESMSQNALSPLGDFVNEYGEQLEGLTACAVKALESAKQSLDSNHEMERHMSEWIAQAQGQCERFLQKIQARQAHSDRESLLREHQELMGPHPLSNFFLSALVTIITRTRSKQETMPAPESAPQSSEFHH